MSYKSFIYYYYFVFMGQSILMSYVFFFLLKLKLIYGDFICKISIFWVLVVLLAFYNRVELIKVDKFLIECNI